MKGQEVREKLAAGMFCLLVNSNEESKPITEDEQDWMSDACDWIRWNAGRVGPKGLADGIFLLSDMPKRATY